MEEEKVVDFDELMLSKEKRRASRAKGQRTHVKGKLNNKMEKPRNMKNISYSPDLDEDYFED